MKKMLHKICVLGMAAFLAMGFTGCDSAYYDNIYSGNVYNDSQVHEITDEIPTIEDFGAIIVSAGTFWEDWWKLEGAFANLEWTLHDELPESITAERGFAFGRLAPESGFESLIDIRTYLRSYYTHEWIDEHLMSGIPYVGAPFIEYNDALFVDATRAGFPRPNWETATHTLAWQDGDRAVVETTVLWGSWHRAPYESDIFTWEVPYIFTFVGGKIDRVETPYGVFELQEIARMDVNEAERIYESYELAIIRAGWFWEDWWNFGRYDVMQGAPPHIAEMGYAKVAPSTGLESLDDVRERLSWLYSERWIYEELTRDMPVFKEYDGVLYLNILRPDVPRPDWGSARHTVVAQDADTMVVETTVMMNAPDGGEPFEEQFHSLFISHFIDYGRGMN